MSNCTGWLDERALDHLTCGAYVNVNPSGACPWEVSPLRVQAYDGDPPPTTTRNTSHARALALTVTPKTPSCRKEYSYRDDFVLVVHLGSGMVLPGLPLAP